MRNVRRWVLVTLIASVLAVPPAFAEDQQPTRQEPQTYESPLLALLFLPVTVLVKMASVFRPESTASEDKSAGTPRD